MHYEIALTDAFTGDLMWSDKRDYIEMFGIEGLEWAMRCKWFPVEPGEFGMTADGPAIFIRYQ